MNEREKIEQAIQELEYQRARLGDVAVDAAIAGLRNKLADVRPAAASVADLAGERKLVTVMFADLSGFTALSERLDPEQVRSLMNSCFDTLVPIVEKYEGVVDKFIGDEIMALFGAPRAHEHDAENCLRAALEMMESLKAFNRHQKCSLGMHMGINTGTVVTGGIGSDGRQQYSVLGDAVNLAARLEDASETGQILVGANTFHLTAALFDYNALPAIRVKGKSGLVPIYQLLNRKTVADGYRGLVGLHSALVGRDAELRLLQTRVEDLGHGRGRLVGLSGEPGVGKSRLVAEARQASSPEVLWVEGRAQSYTQGMPYSVVQSMLDGLLGITPDATLGEVATAFRSSLEALFPQQDDFDLVFPYLVQLRGAPLNADEEERLRRVAPEAMQNRARHAFSLLIRALCRERSLVLVWEDLHWSDAASLGLLEALVPLVEELPLMILCAFRPQEGDAQEWFQRISADRTEDSFQMELGPLTDGESRTLVENLLQVENLQDDTRAHILSKAEGNPFFLEEILRSLLDAGLVILQAGQAIASPGISLLLVPETLQGVIAARIDQLPVEDKHTLQMASVIGRVFQKPILDYLRQRERAPGYLDICLRDLQRRELIRRRAELEYIFKHAVTQDVTYNSLLIARRTALHQIVAEAIEALFPEHVDELAATLAYHYQRSALTEKAVHYSIRAGDHARKAYANTEAIAFYREALKRMDASGSAEPRISELQEKLGEILTWTGQKEDAGNAFQAALAACRPEDWIRRSCLYRKYAAVFSRSDNPRADEAVACAESCLRNVQVQTSEYWHEWLDLYLQRLDISYWRFDAAEMTKWLDMLAPEIDASGTLDQKVVYLHERIRRNNVRDRFRPVEETVRMAHERLQLLQAAGDSHEIAWGQMEVGFVLQFAGRLDEAEEFLNKSLQTAQKMGDHLLLLISLSHLSITHRRQNHLTDVLEESTALAEALTKSSIIAYEGIVPANRAWLAYKNREWQKAEALARDAIQIWATEAHQFPAQWTAWTVLLALAVEQRNVPKARSSIEGLLLPHNLLLASEVDAALHVALQACDESSDAALAACADALAQAAQAGYV